MVDEDRRDVRLLNQLDVRCDVLFGDLDHVEDLQACFQGDVDGMVVPSAEAAAQQENLYRISGDIRQALAGIRDELGGVRMRLGRKRVEVEFLIAQDADVERRVERVMQPEDLSEGPHIDYLVQAICKRMDGVKKMKRNSESLRQHLEESEPIVLKLEERAHAHSAKLMAAGDVKDELDRREREATARKVRLQQEIRVLEGERRDAEVRVAEAARARESSRREMAEIAELTCELMPELGEYADFEDLARRIDEARRGEDERQAALLAQLGALAEDTQQESRRVRDRLRALGPLEGPDYRSQLDDLQYAISKAKASLAFAERPRLEQQLEDLRSERAKARQEGERVEQRLRELRDQEEALAARAAELAASDVFARIATLQARGRFLEAQEAEARRDAQSASRVTDEFRRHRARFDTIWRGQTQPVDAYPQLPPELTRRSATAELGA